MMDCLGYVDMRIGLFFLLVICVELWPGKIDKFFSSTIKNTKRVNMESKDDLKRAVAGHCVLAKAYAMRNVSIVLRQIWLYKFELF